MGESPRRKIRIGEAAAAIDTTPKAVRQWISRYGDRGLRPTAEQSGTWLEFSFGDVAALAITKYLVDIGMPAHGAFTYAMAIAKERWPGLFDEADPRFAIVSKRACVEFFLG